MSGVEKPEDNKALTKESVDHPTSIPHTPNLPSGSSLPPSSQQQLVLTQAQFGPIPPPQMLAEYDRVLPGLAEQIIRAFEEEGRHRRNIENQQIAGHIKLINAQVYVTKLGPWLAFTSAALLTIVAGILAFRGHGAAAAVVGASDGLGMFGLFTLGLRKKNQSEGQGKSP